MTELLRVRECLISHRSHRERFKPSITLSLPFVKKWSRPVQERGRYLPDSVPHLTVSLRKLGQGESSSGKSGIERLPGVELEQWLLSLS